MDRGWGFGEHGRLGGRVTWGDRPGSTRSCADSSRAGVPVKGSGEWTFAPLPGCEPRFARSGRGCSMSTQVSQLVLFPKSKEGQPMPFRKSTSMGSTGIERVAQGWGKVVARRVEEVLAIGFPDRLPKHVPK